MKSRITPAQVKAADQKWKPYSFTADAIALADLADNRGRALTRSHLARRQMGDPQDSNPLCFGAIPRLTESLSVLYRTPATRRLKRPDGTILEDADPQAQAFAEMSRRMLLDSVYSRVDSVRNLLRQVVVSFVESPAANSVQARVHMPFDVYRSVTASAADMIDEDEAILLQILDAPNEAESLYQLWQHEDDGSWRCWIVDGAGRFVGDQPYGDEGRPPFDGLPLVLFTDSLAAGQPWLPLPESRLDFALNINALVNDLNFIVKAQAHSIKYLTTSEPGGVKPAEESPASIMVLPEGSDLRALQQNPQIAAINETIAQQLSMLAISESLPADAFSSDRKIHTGASLKVAERDLEARRQRQAPLAQEGERRAFRKIRSVHNAFASSFGLPRIDDDLELSISFGTSWQPVDARELQEAYYKDLAIGACSIVDYIQERYRLDRQGAVDLYTQIQSDRAQYPVGQNPGAMIEGQLPALGEGSATPDTEFNPDVASSVEGASVTAAVLDKNEVEAPTPSESAPAVMSGARGLEVGKANAAIDVIKSVAKGEVSRESAVSILQVFFGLTESEAQRVLGPSSFSAVEPEVTSTEPAPSE